MQEEVLVEHFNDLIKFVKTRACMFNPNVSFYFFEYIHLLAKIDLSTLAMLAEDLSSGSDRAITVTEVEPIVKDFASRWKAAIELMHNDVITSFSNFLCGMEILRAALTQLLLYYTRLSDCIKKVNGGSVLNKDLVSISSIMHEIRKYSRTF